MQKLQRLSWLRVRPFLLAAPLAMELGACHD